MRWFGCLNKEHSDRHFLDLQPTTGKSMTVAAKTDQSFIF